MRTTLRIDDPVLKRAKTWAAEAGMSLTALVKEALVAYMERPPQGAKDKTGAIKLPSHGSGGTLPGVDLDDTSALLDLMDESPQ
jgi:hypothetical protein